MFVLYKVWEVRQMTAKSPITGKDIKHVEWRVFMKSGSQWECERYVDKNPEGFSKLHVRWEIEEA